MIKVHILRDLNGWQRKVNKTLTFVTTLSATHLKNALSVWSLTSLML